MVGLGTDSNKEECGRISGRECEDTGPTGMVCKERLESVRMAGSEYREGYEFMMEDKVNWHTYLGLGLTGISEVAIRMEEQETLWMERRVRR